MKALKEFWNIRINGLWNVGIFSVDWLKQYVFKAEEIMLEVGITAHLPQRFTADNVTLMPVSGNLMLIPADFDDATLIRVEEIAYQLLDILPHTPVSAVGFNFGYEIDESSITDMLPLLLKDQFSAQDLIVSSRTFSWSFDRTDHDLNLAFTIKNNAPRVTFNYHKSVPNGDAAKHFIKDRIIDYRNFSLMIMKEVFSAAKDGG